MARSSQRRLALPPRSAQEPPPFHERRRRATHRSSRPGSASAYGLGNDACAPTPISAARWSSRASSASSRTRLAATYSGSGAPDTFVLFHPTEELRRLRRASSRAREEISRYLAQRAENQIISLPCALEDDRVEGLNEKNVGSGFSRSELEGIGSGHGVLHIDSRKTWRRDGSDGGRRERSGDRVPLACSCKLAL